MPIFSTYRFLNYTSSHRPGSPTRNRHHFRRNHFNIAKYRVKTCYFSPGFDTVLTAPRSHRCFRCERQITSRSAGKIFFAQRVTFCPEMFLYIVRDISQSGQQLTRICRRGSANDTDATRPSWISPYGGYLRGYLMISKYIYTYTYLFIINTSYLKMRFFNG